MTAEQIFSRLWNNYILQNTQAKAIYDLFIREGETVINDHIAFRTVNDPRVNIDVLARPFLKAGFVEKAKYSFTEKHLLAKHYELENNPTAPRVFISELVMHHFTDFVTDTFHAVLNKIPFDILEGDEILFSGRTWGLPSFETYQKLRDESEYAAWLYVYGYCANHFTVSINQLKKYSTIVDVNSLLKSNGFALNSLGGEIKGNPDDLLQQSSTLAELLEIHFVEGIFKIPSCYYEFAQRYPDDNGKLYNGFIAKSADKIFESTDFRK